MTPQNSKGITFYMQNMSWIQPPGYVHQMIHKTWLPFAVQVDTIGGTAPNATLSASAQTSEDGKHLRILVANNGTASCRTDVVVNGWEVAAAGKSGGASITAKLAVLSGDADDANTPANPTKISPTSKAVQWKQTGATQLLLPPLSFAVVTLTANL